MRGSHCILGADLSVQLHELGKARAHLVDCSIDLCFVHFAVVLEGTSGVGAISKE
jgi:hypothetical protein